MENTNNTNAIKYFSLDEAREEIKKRWADVELKKKIEEKLGDYFFKDLFTEPRAVVCRPIVTPDNGIVFFINCSHYLGLKPFILEYTEDKYVVINEEKRGLTKLRVWENNKKEYINIVNNSTEEGHLLSDVVTNLTDNTKLIDFHHSLFNSCYPNVDFKDYSAWFKKFKTPDEYYFYYLLNFIAHGVYFEFFYADNSKRETDFVWKNVLPNIQKIRDFTGLDPILVKLYPEDQTEDEDFYWFSYTKKTQEDIINLINKV
jgi:hypothetical protein